MPAVPSVSPATGNPTSSTFIHTTDSHFVDNSGRTLLLRGVNLSGSSKAPVGKPSNILEDFWEDGETGEGDFLGRPLELEDGSADIHLARLRGWGFNMLRFPVTWEALEHAGPGIYDEEFMDYTVQVLQKCKEYGFKVYMDPHQDNWSRFSGGSGAPYWTLAACGLNPRNFTATQAAIIHCEYPLAHMPDSASIPAMTWSTNYGRLVSQTVFTLFFAGRFFAPKCILDGQNIQDYLQTHYLNAFARLAEKIRDAGGLFEECVIGWDSLNEPFEGLVEWDNLNQTPTGQGSTLKKGTYPTPAQSLRLGMGQAQTVDSYTFGAMGPRLSGTVTIDPKGRTVWADPDTEPDGVHPKWGWTRGPLWKLGTCIWAQHGIWDIATGYVIRPDYFKYTDDGVEIEFLEDCWRPHWQEYARRIRKIHPEAIMFVQPPVFAPPPIMEESDLRGRVAYSGHYYDGLTLITRHWNWFNADALGLIRGKYKSTLQAVKIGEPAIRRSLQEQLAMLRDDAKILGSYPTIIGEIGIPYDMDDKRSYGWTDNEAHKGDYTHQERALDASLNAADGGNGLSWTVWTYCPDSTHAWGDGWNMEDLSLWSADDLRGGDGIQALYKMGDRSDAPLLRSRLSVAALPKPAPIPSPRGSAVSVATLPTNGAALDHERPTPIMTRHAWSNNPFDFLTDGARAVRAFSRPWPIKTIGIPVDMTFNISKAEFSMVVKVRPVDRPQAQAEPGGEELATEIYVPLVHYCHARYLHPHVAQSDDGSNGDESHGIPTPVAGSQNPSAINLTTLLPDWSSQTSNTVIESASGHEFPPIKTLDLEVITSIGRWEVAGQILKWWYPVPAEGELPGPYTIHIKRKGGAIKAKHYEDRACSWRCWWCAEVCNGEGCRIM